MPKAGAAIVLAGLLCAACTGRTGAPQTRTDGPVGTSGRIPASGAVTVSTVGEPPVFVSRDRDGERLWSLTKQFYQKRDKAPAWIDAGKPTPKMDELIHVLQRTDREGIDPALYNASILSARHVEAARGVFSIKGFDEREAADLDVWLTYLYLQYASDLTYLHDTPADSLFARATRSFIHGCVRLEQPDKLAQYVLAEHPAWTPERIDRAMHGGQETTVKLARSLPVYLGYWTARISADGILQFRADVYGIDTRQSTMLAGAMEKLKARAAAAGAAAEARAAILPNARRG